ncbi:hypothetical protein [Moorena producens]|uniref:hypothetical protein n=1 Tax=Moorena producens TaxID=1155739 RepID=UPI0013144FBB|nr:hypothetical protein [Moorena producens]
MQSLMGETTAVAHGAWVCVRNLRPHTAPWEPRQLLMGETPKTALAPQDRAASPRPRCIARRIKFATGRT